MERLSAKLFVWPPPRQALFYRQKLHLIHQLDQVAATVTLTNRPATRILTHSAQFTGDTVLKREGSCQAKTRHFKTGPSSINDIDVVCHVNHNNSILDRRRDPNDTTAATEMLWMAQDVVKPLRHFGEWRVFVVGGKICSMVGTTPWNEAAEQNVMRVSECKDVFSLNELW